MNDDQLLRYSRQIMLPEIDVEGQQKLLESRCLIIGMGGLGSPAAMYLAAAGTGTLILNDFDRVDLSNLQRQVIHGTDDIGKEKVISADQTLRALNPDIRIEIRHQRLSGNELTLEVEAADVVLDCSDNFSTRFAVNQACVKTKTPLVSGAAIRFEGQVTVFNPLQPSSPCYNCLYANIDELSETCAQSGVIAPLTGAIGSIQALETMKFICGIGEPLVGRLLLLDGLTMEWHRMQLPKDPACPTCSLSA
ncbi:MAG: molybdopterin-synthase adenylyltransferase MoeB [Pseudomonadota bacterium]|jgi:adenylyltransferase/sulfurtransferase|nr:molybdopterin-synthase adenylyltransferase MoeB [Pseudomonadota bacterium]